MKKIFCLPCREVMSLISRCQNLVWGSVVKSGSLYQCGRCLNQVVTEVSKERTDKFCLKRDPQAVDMKDINRTLH